jgi:RNA polymerase-binding transcription factor DksA
VPWTRHCIECQEKAEKGLLEAAQSFRFACVGAGLCPAE